MKRLRYKLEHCIRFFRLYLDYCMFQLTNLNKKPIPDKIEGILIIELKYIGDIIAITPVIRALKKYYPWARIDVLVPKGMEDVLKFNPNINKVYTNFDVKDEYDLGIMLHGGTKVISEWLKKKARFRIGCSRPLFREGKGYYLDRKTKPSFKLKHKIEDNLDVVKTINVVTNDKKLEIYTDKKIKKDSEFMVIISPGVRHAPSHEWFPERFAKLADILIEKYNAEVIFTGTEKDRDLVNEIISLMKNKVKDTTGKLSIQELFGLIKNSDLLISVDTGPIHIGAGFNKPVIALFGAGEPKTWRPYSEKAMIIYKDNVCVSCMRLKCPRNDKECMRAINVEDVLMLVDKIYNKLF